MKWRFTSSFEAGLFALYVAMFVRQYFWSFNSKLIWATSFIIASIISVYFYSNKKSDYESWGSNKYFIILVLFPLVLFYLLRFVFPDSSWDIINYHFINGERAINGFPFISGDFFYLAYSNPVTDMLTTIFRHGLGHRLGTVLNLIVLIWSALIIDRILRPTVSRDSLRSLLIIAMISFEGVIYQISNYWVDLLAIPLILELLYFIGFAREKTNSHYYFCALIMGIAVGFKLTNLYFIIPASSILIYQYLIDSDRRDINTYLNLLGFIVIFFLPLLPFHGYIFWETGNPVFPHYNWIFQSPYASLKKVFDNTLGPSGVIESYFWPVIMLFKSDRLSPTPMYPLITGIVYLISWAIITLSFFKKSLISKELRIIAIFFVLSAFLWGLVSGDYRYVTVFEIIGSIILIMLAPIFFGVLESSVVNKGLYKLFAVLIVMLCLFKIGFSTNKILQYEWAGRPSMISNFPGYWREFKYVLRDHSLYKFLPDSSRKKLDRVEVWVSSSPVISGYMAMLNPAIPYLDLHHLPIRGEGGPLRFQNTIEQLGNKNYGSLINVGTLGLSLEWSLDELMKQGFVPLQVHDLSIPYFSNSPEYLYNFKFVEVAPIKFATNLQERYSVEELHKMNSTLVVGEWEKGCSAIEKAGNESWRWCGKSSLLRFKNFSNKDMELQLNFNAQLTSQPGTEIVIRGKRFKDTLKVDKNKIRIEESFKILAKEEYLISIETNANRYSAPGDPRELYMRVSEFSFRAKNEN